MPGHLYEPGGSAPLPGVLVLHTLAGPDPNLEAFAKRLAAEGYVTLTPDFFALHDFGPDGRTDHPLILKDLDGALEYVTSHPDLGGVLSGRAARAEPLPARIRAIRAPLLIHHGEADANVPVEQARLLHRAMLAAGKSSSLYTYPGADHLFNFSIGPDIRFDPAAAELSWDRTSRSWTGA